MPPHLLELKLHEYFSKLHEKFSKLMEFLMTLRLVVHNKKCIFAT